MRVRTFLALLCTLLSAGHAQAMSHGLAAFANRSTALVAQGRIHRNEAGRLLSFLQQTGAGPGIPRTLVLSSPGGELVGALALGATLRQLGVRTVVGSITGDGYGQATLGAGQCHSACVFVVMGGTARSVIPGSVWAFIHPCP